MGTKQQDMNIIMQVNVLYFNSVGVPQSTNALFSRNMCDVKSMQILNGKIIFL